MPAQPKPSSSHGRTRQPKEVAAQIARDKERMVLEHAHPYELALQGQQVKFTRATGLPIRHDAVRRYWLAGKRYISHEVR